VTGENKKARVAKVAAYVLAGGASRRFGFDKALAEIDGKPMLVHMCELLGGVADSVNVVAAPGKYPGMGARSVEDRWPGEGPLGGIITALRQTETDAAGCKLNLIVSCDMPFLRREWLTYLVERALASSAEVVVPQSSQGLEPLCACWRTSGVAKLEQAFADGVRKVTEAMKRLETEVLDESHWGQFDGAKRLFWNMNTLADYDEAKRIFEAEHA
jgi:molybdopterin-guanine dinucleotide biosynthesis protein A